MVTDREHSEDTPSQQAIVILAHHEAAHAVIAIELGLGILKNGIDLARAEEAGGIGSNGCRLVIADLTEVELDDLPSEQRRLAGQIDCNGAVLAAGPASDAKLRGEDPWHALHQQRSDLAKMQELLQLAQLAPDENTAADRLRIQMQLAVDALNDPEIWRAVEAVAEAAVDKRLLAGSEIEGIASKILEAQDQR